MIIYLDDILILHESKMLLEPLVSQICQLLETLGLLINRKKSLLTPTQQLKFLGFQICSLTLIIQVPSENMRKIRQGACHLLHQTTITVRDLGRFVGKTSATVKAIQAAPLHYKSLQYFMNSVVAPPPPQLAAEKFKAQVKLSSEAVADLTWWTELSPQANPSCSSKLGSRVTCIQHGMGSHEWPRTERGTVVCGRGNPPYKLPGTPGSVSCTE